MKEDQIITITDKDGNPGEYRLSEFSKEGIRIINHIINLNSQIDKLGFDIEQAQGSREYFNQLLTLNLPIRE